MTYGPLQLIAIGFGHASLPLDFVSQLRRLRDEGIVRLIDAAFVSKDEHGDSLAIKITDLDAEESILLGSIADALFGFGTGGEAGVDRGAEIGSHLTEDGLFGLSSDDIDEIADRIPRGTAATFILLEHLWAIDLKQAIQKADGGVIAQGWVTPATLISIGERMAEEIGPRSP